MNLQNRYDGIEKSAVLLIRSKAKQLVGRYGFTKSDRVDIEQALMQDLHQHLPRFNPKRAKRKTFINRVVDHAVVTLVRRQKAAMRDHRRNGGSLSEDVKTTDGRITERADTLDAEMNRASRSDLDGRLLVLDVHAVVAVLPEDLRDLAVRLQTQSMAQAARDMGMARSVVYERVAELRRVFERAGLRGYLCPLADT
ncbi:MAG: sigma-70 family RNA polymerase sigma factor [Planctomycetota bacterium]|nr:sigma-70 family RNA polymerase sigma factor [Planctomycetota bacterium]